MTAETATPTVFEDVEHGYRAVFPNTVRANTNQVFEAQIEDRRTGQMIDSPDVTKAVHGRCGYAVALIACVTHLTLLDHKQPNLARLRTDPDARVQFMAEPFHNMLWMPRFWHERGTARPDDITFAVEMAEHFSMGDHPATRLIGEAQVYGETLPIALTLILRGNEGLVLLAVDHAGQGWATDAARAFNGEFALLDR
ncbi:MAG: hypothetical protein KI792_12775 [Alphaproteobacteria bacterium]|nr:hypothetical protein [Alphaproteobacteria bacterium SS10]